MYLPLVRCIITSDDDFVAFAEAFFVLLLLTYVFFIHMGRHFVKIIDSPGEKAAEGGKELRQQAGEIMACTYIFLSTITFFVLLYVFTISHSNQHTNT